MDQRITRPTLPVSLFEERQAGKVLATLHEIYQLLIKSLGAPATSQPPRLESEYPTTQGYQAKPYLKSPQTQPTLKLYLLLCSVTGSQRAS